ncbi:hypothetical protein FNV43_RR26737 [Rhamnella rubrinervis]|uniref:Uncharacterized protein n=1 Tax=Rhamnella rubrinervis TaxID=2594499 RepID=A0A8K0DQF6_9ROSA|nr:hypothetical protein FNV43_RR26300 [Rhamnella rubrinervis]KAF3432000.1 hypothetical protein FNV43_RR26737 [Rhamnella rubrinervis]
MSVHSPCKAPPSSASSLPKVSSSVSLSLVFEEASNHWATMPLVDTVGLLDSGIHRHFVLFGLMEFLRKSFDRYFSADEVLQLLDRFYNLEVLKPDDEETEILNHEEEFSLPQSFFVEEES